MPMKSVQLVKRHQVEQLHHGALSLEISGNVQVEAAIAESRRVGDSHRFDLDAIVELPVRLDRQEGAQCLHAIEYAGRVAANDFYAIFWIHGHDVGFIAPTLDRSRHVDVSDSQANG